MLSLLCSQTNRLMEAANYLSQALTLDPTNPILHNNLGEIWRAQGRWEHALHCYQHALTLQPHFSEAHYNLANILKAQGHLTEASQHYQQAIHLKPNYAKAHYNLGNTLLEQGYPNAAIAAYRQAIHLKPIWAEAYNNLGAAMKEHERLDEAINYYRRALELKPDFGEAHQNLACALETQGHINTARQSYQRALALDPENFLLRLHTETLAPPIPASNEEIDRYRADLTTILERYLDRVPRLDLSVLHLSGEPPLSLSYQGRDDLPLKAAYARLFQGCFPTDAPPSRSGKPHLGFVVTRGHEGVFLKCMTGILNHLSEARFKLTVVCSGQGGEQILRPVITNPAMQYLSLPLRFDQAVVAIREASFDLLHYWEVGTDSINYFLPFCRLAPIQCATWGWPVTTGIPQIDYYISCEALETELSQTYYSETLIQLKRLPTYYYRPALSPIRQPRAYFGLPDQSHVYVCSQNLRKIHPDFDPLVAEILRRDPQGLLVLLETKQPHLTTLLQQRLRVSMPDVVERIRFLPFLTEADYFNLLAAADVVLDTIHYGGGANTTYDAFTVSTPIVTLPGLFQRGRYASAAYQQMGYHEGVTTTTDEYVTRAHKLASEPEYRAIVSNAISVASQALFEDLTAVTDLTDFFDEVISKQRG